MQNIFVYTNVLNSQFRLNIVTTSFSDRPENRTILLRLHVHILQSLFQLDNDTFSLDQRAFLLSLFYTNPSYISPKRKRFCIISHKVNKIDITCFSQVQLLWFAAQMYLFMVLQLSACNMAVSEDIIVQPFVSLGSPTPQQSPPLR